MMQSVISAKMGLVAQQKRLETVANNIANINTNGFKSSTANFKDALYSTMQRPVGPQNLNLQQGNGVLVSTFNRNFKDGIPAITGVSLDFCLLGDGFFTVEDSYGNLRYTRNGAFAISNEPDGQYLVNEQGNYVIDTQGKRIKLPIDSGDLIVNASGGLSIGDKEPFAFLNIASFANNDGLEAVGNSWFTPTAASGPAVQAKNVAVKQGYLETSNVDLPSELVRLIRAQRAFSFAGKALTTADGMDGEANNLRT